MSTCDCRDARAKRDYIDETTYVCRGLYQVGIDHYGYPVVFSCDTRMTDHEAVARIEAEREREERVRRKRQELMDAVIEGGGPATYCACGMRAVGRCARCERDICNDDDRCCTWRTGPRGWVCMACDAALDREARRVKKEEEARAKAAYEALPTPGMKDLARFLDGDSTVILDGKTHRTDRVTHADIAAAYIYLYGPESEGVSWEQDYPRQQVGLHPDGTLRGSASTTLKNPHDRFPLASAPPRSKITTLAVVRQQRERRAAEEAAAARARKAREARERLVGLVHSVLRPFLALSPAVVLLASAVLAIRTDVLSLLSATIGGASSGWANVAAVLYILAIPLTLYAVLAGGFVLANRLRENAWTRAIVAAAVAWIPPIVVGLALGLPLSDLSPTVRAFAASWFGDVVVALYAAL
ncbi:hypothetical protein [Actinomycetospora aeridis]|uniref:YIP1 family protein n=1 Tax=Actinomycetospora aeridis TaxID=3129231 RepID=A0ABU8N228_9PSEU